MKNIIFILHACLFLIACKDDQGNSVDVYTITASIDEEDQISLFNFVSKVRLIPLESNDESLVANIAKVVINHDKLFIYDRIQNQVFIYDRNGKYLNKINQKGRGSNEYMLLTDLKVNPFTNQLELLDSWGKLLIFDLDGNYISSIKLSTDMHAYDEFIPLNKDSIAFFSLSEPYTLNIFSRSSLKVVDKAFEGKRKLSINVPITSFYRFRDTVYFSRYLYDDVFSITQAGINPVYQWFFPPHNYIPDEIIPEYDRNDTKEYFRIQELLPYTHINTLENNLFHYTCISIQSSEKYVNILHNKKTNKNIVFHKTSEGVIFTPYLFNDSIAMGPIESWRKKEEYLNNEILDEENMQILLQLSEEDNPILIEYSLKD